MSHRRHFRFSLASLLSLATVVVLFFGYAEWRKARLIRECRELAADGVSIAIPKVGCGQVLPRSQQYHLSRMGMDAIEMVRSSIPQTRQ